MAGGSRAAPGPTTRRLAIALTACFASSGLTQRELAGLIGVSDRQLARYLAGERVLNVEELVALCEALGCEPARLLDAAQQEP